MKNKTVKMVLAVVVLGVCCGAYAGVKTYVAHQEQKESEEDSEESTTVFTASTDNIKSLDFMVDDTETTFEKDDDSWVNRFSGKSDYSGQCSICYCICRFRQSSGGRR